MNRRENLLSLLSESQVSAAKGLLHFYDNFGVRLVLSKEELLSRALARAADWREHVRAGENVLIVLENGEEFVESFFAIVALGAVAVPLSPQVDPIIFIKKTGARASVSERNFDGVRNLARIKSSGTRLLDSEIRQHDIALIQFSSGSTNEPKGVVLTHQAILNNLAQIKKGMGVTPSDVLSGWLPFFHDMGLIGCVFSPLYNDVAAHLMTPKDFIISCSRWLQTVVESRTSIILGPNFLYRQITEKISDKANYDLSALRLALCGAEPVSCEIGRRFQNEFKISGLRSSAFFPVYGMAEAVLGVSFPKLGDSFGSISFGSREVASCGFPLEGNKISILDDSGGPCAEGQEGRIVLEGPSLFREYLGQEPRRTATFDTGDLGFLRQGELFVTGRLKDLIAIHGRKIHPQDIESVLSDEGGIKEKLSVFSVWSERTGEEQIHVAFEVKSRSSIWDLDRLIMDLCYVRFQIRIEKVHMLPPQTLPRTTSGKIRRFELEKMLRAGEFDIGPIAFGFALARHGFRKRILKSLSRTRESRADNKIRRALNRELSSAFASITSTPEKSVIFDKPFSEYQMDSVSAIQLNVRLKETLAAEIPLVDFISFKNLRDVEKYLLAHCRKEIHHKFSEKNL